MSRRTMRYSLLTGALLLAGCAVGPNFTPPDAKAPPAWHDPMASDVTAPARVTSEADPDPRWWLAFNDPELTSLIERATRGNLDLQVAVLRIDQARAGETTAAAQGLPSVSANASYTREQLGVKGLAEENSGGLSGGGPLGGLINGFEQPIGLYQGALDASWELDLFGKVRRSVESARAATAAQIGDRDDALVSLQAEVAETYARLRAAQAARAAAMSDIAAEREVLDLTRDRARRGLVSTLDVENATAQVGATEALVPQYDQQIAQNLNGLAVLLGQTPGALDAELIAAAPIPPPPPEAPIGLPSGLARRRPDIRAAEARLHEQTAQVGVAVAQLYPDISLTGQVGQRAENAGDLARWANNFYSFGPSVSLPIFEGGRLKANVRLARSEQAQAALQYRKTVLTALQDVENALAAFRTEQQRRKSLEATVTADETALFLARDRYDHGLSTFIDVLTDEANLIQARQELIQSTLAVTTNLVTLYKALGGGWRAPDSPA